MQPTIQSQARLKQLAWVMGFLLLGVAVGGGFYIRSLDSEISRLKEDARDDGAALAAARRNLIEARQSAEAAAHALHRAHDKTQAAESGRAKAESLAKTADSLRLELEAKLKAAEAARAEAEAKLKAPMVREPGSPQQ